LSWLEHRLDKRGVTSSKLVRPTSERSLYCVVPSAKKVVSVAPSPDLPFSRDTKHTQIQYGELAQLGERLVCNQEVTGSSPVFSTMFFDGVRGCEPVTPKPMGRRRIFDN